MYVRHTKKFPCIAQHELKEILSALKVEESDFTDEAEGDALSSEYTEKNSTK